MNKLKIQLDEAKENLKGYQDDNIKHLSQIKNLEDKLNQIKYTIHSGSKQLKEKEIENKLLKDELANVNSFKYEKARLEKNFIEVQSQLILIKEDNE